ncbi:MAG: hypothetical protein BMS9Abin11_1052 [Gammaproteobacteria bacterium]|nr:MAG: hypothetical protein BMS9Abin11_1052 [Gammaproteobacteria bacterium]
MKNIDHRMAIIIVVFILFIAQPEVLSIKETR